MRLVPSSKSGYRDRLLVDVQPNECGNLFHDPLPVSGARPRANREATPVALKRLSRHVGAGVT
jgi:hypothetical protein